ncbi:MAG TPA: response regulator transcription factor [Anaerolineae bacterium]|nr:response regulator transcription factor [Anaerolineae bacterium]
MTKILLIDDDPLITEPLARSLRQHGYTLLIANNGQKGLDIALNEKPHVVVLDIMMPVMDGWAVCRELRRQSPVPILMLTALDEEVDRILGLELGADDYLTKPFSTRELLARIKALLRRVELDRQDNIDTVITIGDITLNNDTRQVSKSGQELTLRYKEFELLYLLIGQAGQVVSRAEIFDKVWGTDWLGDTRTLDVHIRWLREKIEADASSPHYIQTVRGVGYRFATEAP